MIFKIYITAYKPVSQFEPQKLQCFLALDPDPSLLSALIL